MFQLRLMTDMKLIISSEPKKYDNANSGASFFEVDIDGQDHLFHVGFKKKERTLTINAESGGSVTPSGKDIYQVNKPITITATAKPGYKLPAGR